MREEPPDPLLDLPLPGEQEEEPSQASRRPTVAPVERPSRAPRRIVLAVLVIGAATAGYFLPRAGPPVLRSELDLVDFEQQRVGQPSEETLLEIRNAGERTLALFGTQVVGPDATDLEVVEDTCSGSELPPGADCGLILRLTPGAAGDRAATLVIAGEAPNSPLRVPVVGNGIQPEIGIEPLRRSFPTVIVGYTGEPVSIRLRNNGSAPLAIESAYVEGQARADFQTGKDDCSGRSIAPDETCEIQLTFSPSSIGERAAFLRVETDAPGESPRAVLAATAVRPQPLVALDEDRIDFDEQLVGTGSAPGTVRIRNGGTGGLTIREIEVVDDNQAFRVEAGTCGTRALSADDACELQIRFAPATEGELSARVTVSSNSDAPAATITLSGIGIQPRLEISTAQISFGTTPLGEERSDQLRLRNAGTAPLDIGAIRLERQVASPFQVLDNDCAERQLAPAASCTVSLAFRSRDEGLHRGELLVEHGATSEPARIALSGEGAVGRLQLSSSSIDFGGVAVGSIARQRLSLTNTGSASLTLGRVDFATVAVTDFRMVVNGCEDQPMLPPGEVCALVLEYSPANAGGHSAALSVTQDGPGGRISIEVTGQGVFGESSPLEALPRAVSFGEYLVDTTSETALVRVKNRGKGRVELGAIELRGASAERFNIVGGTCPQTPILGADSQCDVALRFSPRQVGEAAAILTLENGATERPLEVQLSGSGALPAPEPPPEP